MIGARGEGGGQHGQGVACLTLRNFALGLSASLISYLHLEAHGDELREWIAEQEGTSGTRTH